MTFSAALVQMCSGRDMARNRADAEALIRDAAAQGADFIMTPEMTNIIEPDRDRLRRIVCAEAADDTVVMFARLARDLRLWLQAGSLALRSDDGRVVNRSLLFSPKGEITARYDKIHLFDVDLPDGERIRESDAIQPGDEAVVADLPWARLGLTICYDVRFPVLHNTLAKEGATILAVPAAFTVPTGKAHWHILLRARAIETGSFVLAAAQGGVHDSGRSTYGHSLIISPWGEIMAEAAEAPMVLRAEIEPKEAVLARQRIPALRNARPFALKRPSSAAIETP